MAKAAHSFLMGLFVLALALIMWRLTGNFLAWAVLFTPGALLTARGWALVFYE